MKRNMGLNHCFINKNKNIKQHIGGNMKSIAYIASEKVDQNDLENFYEFLRGYTDIFAKNVISTEDHTYKELKTLIHNKDVVILKGDNDSSIVIMKKRVTLKKIETMIEARIKNGTYAEADDTTMKDLKRFQDFLRRHFKKYEHYTEIYPESNEPTKIYGTTKTHKFGSTDKIELTKLKFHPIIEQTRTYT